MYQPPFSREIYMMIVKQVNSRYYDEFEQEITLGINIKVVKKDQNPKRDAPLDVFINKFNFRFFGFAYIKYNDIKDYLAFVQRRTRYESWALEKEYKDFSNIIEVLDIMPSQKFLDLPRNHPLMKRDITSLRCPILKIIFNEDPSRKEVNKILAVDGNLLRKIPNPSLAMERLAVRTTPEAIEYVREETFELQKIALKRDLTSLFKMKKITSETISMALALDPSLINFF